MPYPNQPPDVNDQAFRVATNICMLLDKERFTMGDICRIARYLTQEYGSTPDNNLTLRLEEIEQALCSLRADVKVQLGIMHPAPE